MNVLLATCRAWPDGEPPGTLIDQALRDRGVDFGWGVWDDPSVDWSAADLVAVRSTWDYHERSDEFLAWTRAVEEQTPLLNGAALMTWNADKIYLTRLGGLPVVPTTALDSASGLRGAVAAFGESVVKPRIGASGHGVLLVSGPDDPALGQVPDVPLLVQPLVSSIKTVGEHSIFVFDGEPLWQVAKVPAPGEFRAHGERGAQQSVVRLEHELDALAREAVETVTTITGRTPDYARVDCLFHDDRWMIGEIELIEPGLYLDVHPANAESFADLVVRRLADA